MHSNLDECHADNVKSDDSNGKVIFKVRAPAADPKANDAVYVVGSIYSLGCWDEKKAVPLVTTKDGFPIWMSQPLELISDESGARHVGVFEYKYFCQRWLDKEGDEEGRGEASWEPIAARNARVPVGIESSIIITDAFGSSAKGKVKEASEEDLTACKKVWEEVANSGTGPPERPQPRYLATADDTAGIGSVLKKLMTMVDPLADEVEDEDEVEVDLRGDEDDDEAADSQDGMSISGTALQFMKTLKSAIWDTFVETDDVVGDAADSDVGSHCSDAETVEDYDENYKNVECLSEGGRMESDVEGGPTTKEQKAEMENVPDAKKKSAPVDSAGDITVEVQTAVDNPDDLKKTDERKD